MSNPEGAFGVFKGAIERSSRDLVESEGPQGDNGVKLVSRFTPGQLDPAWARSPCVLTQYALPGGKDTVK